MNGASLRFDSPYGPDARFGNKRSTTWSGYKVHLTETCDQDRPHLVFHVETTPAPLSDLVIPAPVHEALRAKDLLPEVHLVDAKAKHGIELVSPVRSDTSWQAKAGEGYDISAFSIDWDARAVTCPQGHRSVDWIPGQDRWGTSLSISALPSGPAAPVPPAPYVRGPKPRRGR